jgi:catechol 2,3-dioxygenase-like lactoylglutathione lyase family enzyme
MKQALVQIALVVKDYDEAIDFYCGKLGFTLLEDTPLTPTKRWVVVSPSNEQSGCNLLLAKAANAAQMASVGNQTGGRVFLFLHTSNFEAFYQHLIAQDIQIVRPPSDEPYGRVAVFADLYGNLWDLIEPKVLPSNAHSAGQTPASF